MATKKNRSTASKAAKPKAEKPALRRVPLPGADGRVQGVQARLCAARIAGGLPPDPDLARRVLYLAGYLYERLAVGDEFLDG